MRLGSGFWRAAPIMLGQRCLLINASTIMARHPCSQVTTSSSSSTCLRKLLPMVACGPAPKERCGWASSLGARFILSAVGMRSNTWAFRSRIPALITTKPMLRSREALKRELPEQIRQVQRAYPEASVELWSMGEHRVGLKPVIRRVWARKGHRPIIRVQQREE